MFSSVQAPSAGSPGTQAAASLRVQQALEAITRLSKGFSLGLCTRSRPKIGELLQQALQTALHIPLVPPQLSAARSCHAVVCGWVFLQPNLRA